MTAEELPDELKAACKRLADEVTNIHTRWKVYRQLFGAGKERVDLLDESASFFFHVVQNVMIENVFMSMVRLTDPAESNGKPNLVHAQLIEVTRDPEPALGRLLDQQLSGIRILTRDIKKWRNKRLAHNDMETMMATGTDGVVLLGVNREQLSISKCDIFYKRRRCISCKAREV